MVALPKTHNTLVNMIDPFTQEKGTVEIGLEHINGMAKISVQDNGIGISPDEQKLVFDRFFRSDTARAHAQKGTGLGLAICKWIAETHQGQIQIESTPGQGSRFTIFLPLHSRA